MHIIYYHQHQQQTLTPEACTLQEQGVTWIDIDIDNEADMQFLREKFNFHPLTLEDLQHQNQRPKAEEFADYLFVTLMPVNPTIVFRELDVIIGKYYIITAHKGDEPLIEEARRRIDPQRLFFTVSSTYLLYILMDTVLDDYLPILESLEDQSEQLGTEAINNPNDTVLARFFVLKRRVSRFWWTVWPQQDVIHTLMNHELLMKDDRSMYYLRDISDHLARIMNSLQIERDNLTSLINIYMSSVSNQLNYAVNRLTLLTIAVGIIAVFSGFYGMNFEKTWPPFSADWGVPAVMAMMFGTIALAFVAIRRVIR
jgi:magnesium transporter